MSIPAKQPTPEQKKLFQDWMAIHALDDTGRQIIDWSPAPYPGPFGYSFLLNKKNTLPAKEIFNI